MAHRVTGQRISGGLQLRGYQTEMPAPSVRSDQAGDLLTVGRSDILWLWSSNGTIPNSAQIPFPFFVIHTHGAT